MRVFLRARVFASWRLFNCLFRVAGWEHAILFLSLDAAKKHTHKNSQESFYRQAKSENEKLVRERAALQPLYRAIGDLMGHMEKRKADATAGA